MNARPVVTFVTRTLRDKWRDIDALGAPDSFPERIRSGIDVWIVRTLLELRTRCERHGFRVAISDVFGEGRPAIAHRDDLRLSAGYAKSYVAAVRADRPLVHLAPWQIVQNPLQEEGRAVLIPSWPQPGLVARDARRSSISVLGYFGRASSLPRFFRDPAFVTELARRRVSFRFDEGDWRDYSGTDVCIGLRFEPESGLATKPFVKLTNAWLAEVPALLGPEPAYRALRRSPLDYLEVRSGRDVLDAIDRLRADPALYSAMVENGRERAKAYTREAVAQRWCEFVTGRFLPAWHAWRARRPTAIERWTDLGVRLARQWRETRRYKKLKAKQTQALRAARSGETL